MSSDAAAGPSPGSEVIIGLDVGTTATKAVALELGAAWRHVAVREYPLLAPQDGWKVQEPEALRAAVVSALGEPAATAEGASVVELEKDE